MVGSSVYDDDPTKDTPKESFLSRGLAHVSIRNALFFSSCLHGVPVVLRGCEMFFSS